MKDIRVVAGFVACLSVLFVGAGYAGSPAQAQPAVTASPQGFAVGSAPSNGVRALPGAAQNLDHEAINGVLAAERPVPPCYCVYPRNPSRQDVEAFQECRGGLPDCDRRTWEEASDGSLVLMCECGARCVMSEVGEVDEAE